MGELEPTSTTNPSSRLAGDSKLDILREGDRLIVEFGSTQITVETAKRPGKSWDQKAREDIETARASYHAAWGDVPIWDKFDFKDSTFNYIAYVQYLTSNGERVIEALSNRMVLEEAEDLTFYNLNNHPLGSVLEHLLYRERGYNPRVIAGESRIGAIRPPQEKSNTRTIEAFAAIKLKMVEDAQEMGIDYIACQLRNEMPATIFTMNGISYEFPRTETLLDVPIGSVRLNRSYPEVVKHIMSFPGYFLDTIGVYRTVSGLCAKGELTTEEVLCSTGLADCTELLKPRNVKHLAVLMKSDNPVGIILKARLLQEVEDGTFSSISHVRDIEQRAISVLQRLARFESFERKVVA